MAHNAAKSEHDGNLVRFHPRVLDNERRLDRTRGWRARLLQPRNWRPSEVAIDITPELGPPGPPPFQRRKSYDDDRGKHEGPDPIRRELSEDPGFEKEELAQIYVARGVEVGLARQVAQQLMAKDALGAHARDELGISEISTARPVQAALTSAATFSVGAAAPLALVLASPSNLLIPVVSMGSLASLALLGMFGARTGGAQAFGPVVRITFWGALAMALTAAKVQFSAL